MIRQITTHDIWILNNLNKQAIKLLVREGGHDRRLGCTVLFTKGNAMLFTKGDAVQSSENLALKRLPPRL